MRACDQVVKDLELVCDQQEADKDHKNLSHFSRKCVTPLSKALHLLAHLLEPGVLEAGEVNSLLTP